MWLAEYSDRNYDFVSLGKTQKEAEKNMYNTLSNLGYDPHRFDGFDSPDEFIDSEINVYKINCGETMVLGYGTRYKEGRVVE